MVVYHQIAPPSKNCCHLKEPFRGLLGSCDRSERQIEPKCERRQRPQPDRGAGGRRRQHAAVDAASEFQLMMGAGRLCVDYSKRAAFYVFADL